MELELSLTICRIGSINFENPPPQKFLVSLSLLAITSNARRNCPALQESAYVYIMIAFAGFSFCVLNLIFIGQISTFVTLTEIWKNIKTSNPSVENFC